MEKGLCGGGVSSCSGIRMLPCLARFRKLFVLLLGVQGGAPEARIVFLRPRVCPSRGVTTGNPTLPTCGANFAEGLLVGRELLPELAACARVQRQASQALLKHLPAGHLPGPWPRGSG